MKKAHLPIVIFILLFLPIQSLFASNPHFQFGMRLGGGKSKVTGLRTSGLRNKYLPGSPIAAEYYSVGYKFAWDAGFSFKYTFFDDYFLQSDLLASFGGANLSGVRYKKDYIKSLNMNYTQLKFYGGRYIRPGKKLNFLLAAGSYVAYNIGSGGTYTTGSSDNKYSTNFERYDFGLSLLTGVDFNPVVVAFNFDLGINNFARQEHAVRNRALKMALYYYF